MPWGRMLDPPHHPSASALRTFLQTEAAGGLILMGVAVLALVVANSSLASVYFGLLKTIVGGLSILHWINDGLMSVFFLLVGLEIKRELVDGQLATWPRRILPGIAAVGGMVVPALLYVAVNASTPQTLRGWAIPSATDIAFSLGVLALLGARVPVSLKIFLTALAIIDDLGAVTIIAVFYTANLSPEWLTLSGIALAALLGCNRLTIERLAVYLTLGFVLWFFVLKSGVHATLAGVALAFMVPIRPSPGDPDDPTSPLHILEHAIQPWVAFLVVPIFGFANAGMSFTNMRWAVLLEPVTLGIAVGLFVGKQVGVFLMTWLTVTCGWAVRPEGASWPQIYGISLLAGIGFTMSLFIGLLAFPAPPEIQDAAKIGVLLGSVLSAVVGAIVLLLATKPRRPGMVEHS